MFLPPNPLGLALGRRIGATIGRQVFTTIVACGDSYTDVTQGVNSVGSQTTSAANVWINKFASRFNATVLNKGIAGTVLQNSDNGSGVLANNLRDRYQAAIAGANKRQLLVIADGFNDARSTANPSVFNVTNYKADFIEIINGALAAGYTRNTILIVSPWWATDATLATGSAGFTGQTRAGFEAFVLAAQQVAQQFGTWYFDAYAWGRDHGVDLHDYTPGADNIHPGDLGHQIYANGALLATQFPAPALVQQFLTDNFTEADGVLLSAHIADSGLGWEINSGTSPKVVSNQLYCDSASPELYHNMVGPTNGPDYNVTAVFNCLSALSSDNAGVIVRVNPAGGDYYCFNYVRSSASWTIFKSVASVLTTLPSGTFAQTFTSGTKTAMLTMTTNPDGSTTLNLVVDGVTIIGPLTDSSVPIAGYVGVRFAKQQTTTTGIHIDSLIASY